MAKRCCTWRASAALTRALLLVSSSRRSLTSMPLTASRSRAWPRLRGLATSSWSALLFARVVALGVRGGEEDVVVVLVVVVVVVVRRRRQSFDQSTEVNTLTHSHVHSHTHTHTLSLSPSLSLSLNYSFTRPPFAKHKGKAVHGAWSRPHHQ